MKTVKITPRGYCHGVVNAINTISNLDILSTKKPVYILGMVIHNKQIVNALSHLELITLHDESKTRYELLDEIESGTVIFTAHGVSPEVYKKAKAKGLDIIDTTCKDVFKSQKTIKDYISIGYSVIFIGKHIHPESEAAKGISNDVYIVENIEDIKNLDITNSHIALTNQTTMSIFDIYYLSEEAKKYYPNIIIIDEICNSTRIRQEAVLKQDKSIDHCYVVGDKLSNNSQKLAEVSNKKAKIPASLIESVEDIDIEKLKLYNTVSVTSGASTPTKVTKEV
ncbi:MAG: 4-hydroxy-3-methylbut-2-enyl diphosphate reductase, partial [Candidatus Izimaplasma sp.]|nr:4-hydroxy-3-methylbut-2-enyl diphosphate reductase [Candidatus Izimaplasma bacterium]